MHLSKYNIYHEIDFLFIHTEAKKLKKETKLFNLIGKNEKIEKMNRTFGNPKPRPKPTSTPEKESKTFSHALYFNNILIIFLFLMF